MANSGAKVTGTVVSTGSWLNFTTTRLNTSDNSRATINTTSFDPGVLRGFAFNIPASATVTGVLVKVEYGIANTAQTATIRCAISKDAGSNYSAYSAETSVTGTAVDQVHDHGGSSDLWGLSLTPAEVNDGTNFYVKIEGKTSLGTVNNRVDFVTVTVYYTAPALSTLSDNFDNNTFDGTLYNRIDATQVVEANQNIEITTKTTAGYFEISSLGFYSLTGSAVSVKLVASGNQALASYEAYPLGLVDSSGDNLVQWAVIGGNLQAYKSISATSTTQGSAITYNASTHVYLRIRESGGTVYWEWSTDGITFTSHTSISVASLFAVGELQFVSNCGCYGAEASTTTMKIDDLNILPSAGTPSPKLLTLLGVGS